MMSLLSFGFATPMLLGALVLLPAIWWLFRLTPPRPRLQSFPPTRLLLALSRQEEHPVRTPWWLTLIRLVLAGAVILALAGLIWQPMPARDTATGPLWLIVDNGWAAGPDWATRKAAAERIVAEAADRNRPVALILTAEGAGQQVVPGAGAEALRRLASAEPRPWVTDRMALLAPLQRSAAEAQPGSIAFLTDGLASGDGDFAAKLKALAGPAPILVHADTDRPILALTGTDNSAETLTAAVRRVGSGTDGAPEARPLVAALDQKGRQLAAEPVTFAPGQSEAKATFALPSEMRNEIARIEISGVASAGAVQLIDERWRRRKVGLIAGTKAGAEQPLLAPLHYLTTALAPFADLRLPVGDDTTAALKQFIRERVSVIVMADVGTIPPEVARPLADWVAGGGVLVRFAGPRLALGQERDPLVPVDLRRGGRSMGGALSWGQPQKLAPFPATGPFAGMATPTDVTVSRQILAEPRPDLATRTWASLTDGTPLVTGNRSGQGWLVLFHVTADASWSSLPLSGSFLDMLHRIVSYSVAAGASSAEGQSSGAEKTLLPPYRLLNGFGATASGHGDAEPLATVDLSRITPSRTHPPGLYGNEDGVVALNLLTADSTLVPLDLTPLAPAARFGLAAASETDLRPLLLAGAFLMLLLDAAVVIAMAGGFALRRVGTAAVLALVLFASGLPRPADAADNAADEFNKAAALGTRLAYVLTGNAETDEVSRAGLEGLSRVLADRTALEPAAPQGVDVERDELAFFPLLYWPVEPGAAVPSAKALARIDAYMKNGGTILFDTRDTLSDLNLRGAGRGSRANETLRAILAPLDIPALEPVPEDHVLTKAFYILKDFPGRYSGGALWAEATPALTPEEAAERPVRPGDGVSPILITGNDLAGAWAIDGKGEYMFATVPPEPRQRELAYRVGVNIVMYTLTGNYKADQVHVPALLERLGQ